MADIFQKIFQSELFTFFVGMEKTPIVVHSGAITKHSEVLTKLTTNGMIESQTKIVNLPEVIEEDFIRFCQFAYTGDYSPPPFVKEPNLKNTSMKSKKKKGISAWPNDDEAPAPPPKFAGDDIWSSLIRRDVVENSGELAKEKDDGGIDMSPSKTTSLSPVWTSWGVKLSNTQYLGELTSTFSTREFYDAPPNQELVNSCNPTSNNTTQQNFTNVFLAHARLYVFADKYLIKPLQKLVLHKLQKTLSEFNLHPERVDDVLSLVRYVYSDEHTRDDGTDELRALVMLYVASRATTFNESDSFIHVLEEGGPFVRDFWWIVRNCLRE